MGLKSKLRSSGQLIDLKDIGISWLKDTSDFLRPRLVETDFVPLILLGVVPVVLV